MKFTDALNTSTDEIERPPLLPIGTYEWAVTKHPEMDSISDGKWDVVDFTLQCLRPTDDVDEDALREYGSINNKRLRHRFMFNTEDEGEFNRTLFNLKRFITEHLQADVSSGADVKQLLAASVNCHCLGSVKWRPDQNDKEVFYEQIARTAPVE